jgi:hypothetical protein
MRRPFVLALLFTAAVLGQKVETEGKAWLNANTAPAEMNVNGAWHAGEWGLITLNQAAGSRDVTGTVKTDANFVVLGVVSAKKVFLLFTDKGRVWYSVEASPERLSTLAGHYADGLSWKSGTRLMHMTRADAQDNPAHDPKTQAHVVFYRAKDSLTKRNPSVYCDDQEVALMHTAYYFTVALSPGKHTLSSSSEYIAVTLDAEPGATYYIRLSLAKEGTMVRFRFGVEQVDGATALKEISKLKPAEASHITRRDIVSTALPAK